MRIATAEWRPWLPWAWAALSGLGAVIGFLAAFGIAVTYAGVLGSPDGDVRLDLALWFAAWGGLSVAGVLVGGRLAFGRWLPVSSHTLAAPMAGIALAVTLELTLSDWAVGRFGRYDSDMIGPTAVLPFLLVPIAVALFGVLIAPRGSAGPPMLVLVAVGGTALVVASGNLGGALAGIGADSWMLAAMVALAVAYLLGAVVLVVRRLRPG